MNEKLRLEGYKKYAPSCNLYVKQTTKHRHWIVLLIDTLVQFLAGTFIGHEFEFLLEIKYCGMRRFLFWRRVCFSFTINAEGSTVYFSSFIPLNFSNLFSVIKGIWSAFSGGTSIKHLVK